jgi:ABC-type multidrug transport system ATPase subunit
VSEPVVRLRGVGKRYRRGPWVLRDVDLAPAAGAVTVVRGPNGAGKSTLLRLLAGATAPTAGRREAAPCLPVGYAPDALDRPPALTAATYLRHHARIRGLAGAGASAAPAEQIGLGPLMRARLPELSKGELHKVVLAQALLGRPRLLVLDEPYANLDAGSRDALRAILRARAADGAAVVITDHDGRPECRVVRLDGGRVADR